MPPTIISYVILVTITMSPINHRDFNSPQQVEDSEKGECSEQEFNVLATSVTREVETRK